MKKLILPITILLIIGFVASLFMGLREKPLPEMERVEIPGGRVSLLLPTGAVADSTPEDPVQIMTDEYCTIQILPDGPASEDFPETEIWQAQKGPVEITRLRPDLFMFTHKKEPYADALLKHPDGGLIHIELVFNKDIKEDKDFCKRMREAILTSIQPEPTVLNLSERTETLDSPDAGISLEIAVPKGFSTEHYSSVDDDGAPHKRMLLWWMRPATREGNTFYVSIITSENALREDSLPPNSTKQEGILLGQKMEWSIDKRGGHMVLILGSVPCGTQGRHLVVGCLCPEEDLPTFFSLVEKIKPTETQP